VIWDRNSQEWAVRIKFPDWFTVYNGDDFDAALLNAMETYEDD